MDPAFVAWCLLTMIVPLEAANSSTTSATTTTTYTVTGSNTTTTATINGTSTTSTTSTSTTITTYPFATNDVVRFEGTIVLTVSDPPSFAASEANANAVSDGIASYLGIWNGACSVILSVARRLAGSRSLSGGVNAAYTITATGTTASTVEALLVQVSEDANALASLSSSISTSLQNLVGTTASAASASAPARTIVSAAVIGDPITYFGNVRQAFHLPLGEMHPLLETPDMHILARAMPGIKDEEQWLDRIIVTTPDRERIMEVNIKEGLEHFNRSRTPNGVFETLDIKMGAFGYPFGRLPPRDVVVEREGLSFGFSRVQRPHDIGKNPEHEAMIGDAHREGVIVTGNYAKLLILATSAAEEYGYESDLAVKYAHLDFLTLDMADPTLFRGVLPQLWGVQPITEQVKAMKFDL